MAFPPIPGFANIETPARGVAVVLAEDGATLSGVAAELDAKADGAVAASADHARFKGKTGTVLDLLAPRGGELSRLLVVGCGKAGEAGPKDWLRVGGAIMGKLMSGASEAPVTVVLERGGAALSPENAADVALGMLLRAYRFDRYKSRGEEGEDEPGEAPSRITLAVGDPAAAEKALAVRAAVAEGVHLARDLVNEPANTLGPVEFAKVCSDLDALGVDVEILDEDALSKIGMRALLGVSDGSARPPRVAIMRWMGGGEEAPAAFIGKGVVFDTGGISIKPAASMEDMKGDMAGAACVVGLMHALAKRKARANAVGVVGLVENMPDGKSQRPGDIVKALSGKTIEIINTDAEGRLVLADLLCYVQREIKPRFMVDLATLTGAIIIALGHDNAGLFSNDDELSARLTEAGRETGEAVWRLPLAREYDKLIDSKFADMKNTGGRAAGSITAAQFLKRFVDEVPWAHLDIAGTGFGAPQTETNRSWGAGWGVRLLDRLVHEHYET